MKIQLFLATLVGIICAGSAMLGAGNALGYLLVAPATIALGFAISALVRGQSELHGYSVKKPESRYNLKDFVLQLELLQQDAKIEQASLYTLPWYIGVGGKLVPMTGFFLANFQGDRALILEGDVDGQSGK